MTAAGPPGVDQQHLQALADHVTARTCLRARIVRPGRGTEVFLRVINPAAADLAEDVRAVLVDDQWHYQWSWGELIAPVQELARTAAALSNVLRPAN